MPNDAIAELQKLNARFIHNFVTNDVPSHDAIIHRDFVCIRSDGCRIARREYLDYWAAGFDPAVITYCYRDERIAVFGDTGLVWSVNRHVRQVDGREAVGMTGYTDTYVREDGVWRCVQAQLTNLQPQHYPPDSTIVRAYIRGVVSGNP